MRTLGYVEGRNLVIEWRYAQGRYERLPVLAAELAQLKVDVLVTYGTAAVQALHAATDTIPIVIAAAIDPGGNMTGLSAIALGLKIPQALLISAR